MYKKYVKRLLDIFISFTLIVLLLPLLIVLFIITKLSLKGTAIYKQERIGLNEKPYTMYKFKTMSDVDKTTPKISAYLRKTGFDELLQLINVLKGDMSIIGPRPFIVGDKLPTMYNKLRHTVRPGITGYAQANGRRFNSHEEKLKLDDYYVKNISFVLDIKIFFKTIIDLIKNIF